MNLNTRTVIKSSVFPADKSTVFCKLKQSETLKYVAWPYASFKLISKGADAIWSEGDTYTFTLRIFGLIPFGKHKIHVTSFGERKGIYTHEKNDHVPIWNHQIIISDISNNRCLYTDVVRIAAGKLTFLVWLWANAFYRHRQKRWIRLLR